MAAQLEKLMELLNQVNFSNCPDKQEWLIGTYGSFEVYNTSKHIDCIMLQKDLIQTRWCRLVPIKLNVLFQRVLRDRLPARENLVKRSIDFHSMLLSYVLRVKIVVILFVKYDIANQIWDKVLKWLDLRFPLFNDVLELFLWIDSLRLKNEKMKVVEVICITAIWVLQKY